VNITEEDSFEGEYLIQN